MSNKKIIMSENLNSSLFLFSVDLEDVRVRVSNGNSYTPRVEALVDEYLEFLDCYQAKCTFFTVGDIPKLYPGLVEKIISEGHEVACHSNEHLPVTGHSKEAFRKDVSENLENLYKSGATEIKGYRAPTCSITKDSSWAFEVLSDLGFSYSSSVLPAKNPLYGWEGFGQKPRRMYNNLWELPISLRKSSFLTVPFSAGVYFRVLPFVFIEKSFKSYFKHNSPVIAYFHPYDIDTKQERFMHPEINENRFYNELLYFNRKNVFSRLHKIMKKHKAKIVTYKEYVSALEANQIK